MKTRNGVALSFSLAVGAVALGCPDFGVQVKFGGAAKDDRYFAKFPLAVTGKEIRFEGGYTYTWEQRKDALGQWCFRGAGVPRTCMPSQRDSQLGRVSGTAGDGRRVFLKSLPPEIVILNEDTGRRLSLRYDFSVAMVAPGGKARPIDKPRSNFRSDYPSSETESPTVTHRIEALLEDGQVGRRKRTGLLRLSKVDSGVTARGAPKAVPSGEAVLGAGDQYEGEGDGGCHSKVRAVGKVARSPIPGTTDLARYFRPPYLHRRSDQEIRLESKTH